MERHAHRHAPLGQLASGPAPTENDAPAGQPYRAIFLDRVYRRRMAVLLLTWFLGYITVYSYAAGFTSALTSLHYAPPEAGVIVAVGVVGFIAGSIFTSFFAERLERHLWLPLSAVITLGGAALVAEAGTHIVASFAGSALIFVGFNMWVSPTYALSAESFPSRARTTGFGVVDGIGHLGGGIGVLVISPYIPHLPPIAALMMISGFLVLAAVVVQLAPATRGVPLERVSP